ncbi:MAG: hypothetical protein M1820_000122 [Bogoriella megaspora]|nr:MAG: hypothetical protein M1820_000122 [Bogoriella megaspora]
MATIEQSSALRSTAAQASSSLLKLPVELLDHIVSFVLKPKPELDLLPEVNTSKDPLAVIRVCRSLSEVALQHLFRHATFDFHISPHPKYNWPEEYDFLEDPIFPCPDLSRGDDFFLDPIFDSRSRDIYLRVDPIFKPKFIPAVMGCTFRQYRNVGSNFWRIRRFELQIHPNYRSRARCAEQETSWKELQHHLRKMVDYINTADYIETVDVYVAPDDWGFYTADSLDADRDAYELFLDAKSEALDQLRRINGAGLGNVHGHITTEQREGLEQDMMRKNE